MRACRSKGSRQDSGQHVGPLYEPEEKFSALAGDLFVLTSRFEGFPLVVLEAMACEKPVLVTPGTNAADLVRGSGAGWVCQPHADDIARGILNALEHRDTLRTAGEAARQAVRRLTWRRAAERLTEAYARAISRSPYELAAG